MIHLLLRRTGNAAAQPAALLTAGLEAAPMLDLAAIMAERAYSCALPPHGLADRHPVRPAEQASRCTAAQHAAAYAGATGESGRAASSPISAIEARRRLWPMALLALGCWSSAVAAEDPRQLAPLPPAAAAALQAEMRDNLRALNGVLELIAADKLAQAGELAEKALGVSAMGKHRDKPFEARPGPHMPPAMHAIGIDGHQGASAFARAAASGDRNKALAALPGLTASCVACHSAYRIR